MFSLDKHTAELTNLNFRTQKHGKKELVPAIDLSIAVDLGSDSLNSILPGLRETIFRQPRTGDQLRIANENDAAAFTELRHPDVEPLCVKGKFTGYELSIVRNVSETDEPQWETDAFFADVTVKDIAVAGREGGTAVVTFKASISDIDFDELGDCARAVVAKHAVLVLTPPTVAAQDSDGAEDGADEPAVPAAA